MEIVTEIDTFTALVGVGKKQKNQQKQACNSFGLFFLFYLERVFFLSYLHNFTILLPSTQPNKSKNIVEKSYSLENQSKMVKSPDHSHCILLIFRTANGKKSFTNWLQSLKNDQKTTNSIFQK